MLQLEYSSQFEKYFKKITKMTIPDIVEVGHIISGLQRGEALHKKYVDHSLSGNWAGYRDCHIKPNLELIYKVDKNSLKLSRVGTHSELF